MTEDTSDLFEQQANTTVNSKRDKAESPSNMRARSGRGRLVAFVGRLAGQAGARCTRRRRLHFAAAHQQTNPATDGAAKGGDREQNDERVANRKH